MEDCIIISSDEEEQVSMQTEKQCTSRSYGEKEINATHSTSTSKDILRKVPDEVAESSTKQNSDKNESDLTDPVQAFEEFVAICNKVQDPDMEKIIEKMRKYHRNSKPEYTSSREFISFLSCKSSSVLKDPQNIYVFIKDVVDELRERKSKPIEDEVGPPNKKQKILAANSDADKAYEDHKLKLLCKAMEKVNKRIQKLEEQEVDFDDENDSTYIRLERYKERLVKIYEKICELSGEQKIGLIHRRKISFTGTNSPEINKCIEKFINKTGQFPDFHDILSLVKTVETEKNKSPEQIRQTAIEAFVKAGEQLQLRRRYESWQALSAFMNDESDPAETNPELLQQLKKNNEENANRIPEVIDHYAEKQTAEKLVPEEVPDEEGDESEGQEEDEDEDEVEEGEEEEEQGKDENETEFMEKVLSGNMSDDSEEEDHAKGTISLENLEHTNFNGQYGRGGSVSPPVLGENLNERFTSYLEDSSEHDEPVIVVVLDEDNPNKDQSSCENQESIVIE